MNQLKELYTDEDPGSFYRTHQIEIQAQRLTIKVSMNSL